MFIDRAKIFIKAGDGGKGCVSFRREKYVPLGGPDGGNGGTGGDVIFLAVENKTSLLDFRYRPHLKAKSGTHGKGKDQHGHQGENLVVSVPIGTLVKDAKTESVLYDFSCPGESVLLARGGRGGRGNASFASGKNRAPRIATDGMTGEEKTLQLELKLLCDIGFIGFPNAGKSTLLNTLSSARSKVADYPFTTMQPVLGILRYGDYYDIVLSDMPGLIEGAHNNIGLGHEFLRHIERSRCLLFVIDLCGYKQIKPWDEFEILKNELALHKKELLEKQRIIACNKNDLPDAQDNYKEFLKKYGKTEIIVSISSLFKKGLEKLKTEIWKKVEYAKKEPSSNTRSN
ncbi:GTPase ObgE [Chlamydiota bacterium]